MATSKKYYWLKLKEDFFREKEIKKLRKIAGGDTYTIIYLKMILLSLKNEGKLYFEGVEDTFIDEIALEIDEDVENVKVTVMFLVKCGLIEELQENEFMMVLATNSLGSETQGAERVRRYRASKKALQYNGSVTNCNTEIDIDIELDKEIELEIDKDNISVLKQKKIDYVFFISTYNDICTKLPRCKKLTENRKKSIRLYLSNNLTKEDFQTICRNANASAWHTGKNDTGWTADFDFLLRPNKAISLLEKSTTTHKTGTGNPFLDMMVDESEGQGNDQE